MCRLRLELYIIKAMPFIDLEIVWNYLGRRAVVMVVLGVLAGINLYTSSNQAATTAVGGTQGNFYWATFGIITYTMCIAALVLVVRERGAEYARVGAWAFFLGALYYCAYVVIACINSYRLYTSGSNDINLNNFLFYPVFNFISLGVMTTQSVMLARLCERLKNGVIAPATVQVGASGPTIQEAQAVLMQPAGQEPTQAVAILVADGGDYPEAVATIQAKQAHRPASLW